MSDTYTPNDGTVRECYVYGRWAEGQPERHFPEFDRWIAAHDADKDRQIDALVKVGEFRIDHLFRGACPDTGGHDDRDLECPACIILVQTAPDSEGEN